VQNGWVVVDIGAGMGDFTIHAAFGNPETKVYAFEPFPSSFQLLTQNLSQNGIENVTAFQKAVWSRDGQLTLDLSSGEPLQISSTEDANIHDARESVSVEAVSLESMLQRENLSHIDLLKLDCEGAEYEILMDAAPKVITRIQRIIMEYHDVDAKHHHSILENFLESQGFSVTHYQNFVHDNIGYLYAEQRRKNE
jgi:FkbM family methyltransferase